MSAQTLPMRGRQTFASWRYAAFALIVAIALATAVLLATSRSAGQTNGGSGQTAVRPAPTTFVIPGGPAKGHPLP